MKKTLILPSLIVVMLSGCAYYQPIGISSTSIGSQYERPSGIAEGVARRWYIFPCYELCPMGEDSLKAAIEDALDGNVGDTLANVYAERRTIVFPHLYFPLIIRTDIIVTGTLVKYNTKEFPPDHAEYMYSNNPVEVWRGLLGLEKEEQRRRVRVMPARSRDQLVEYAYAREYASSRDEKEAQLFESVTGRVPLLKPEPQAAPEKNGMPAADADCSDYHCLAFMPPDQQAWRIEALDKSSYQGDQVDLAKILSEANKRIRGCFPKREESVWVRPELNRSEGEKRLLEYLCKNGYTKR